MNANDINILIILIITDFKLVMRTTKIYIFLPFITIAVVFLTWIFGARLIYLYLSIQIIILNMIFSTQFTRTDNEMASYCILPFSKKALVLSKNINSMFCVGGLTSVTLLITAIFVRLEVDTLCHSTMIIMFVSVVLLSTGNAISIKSLTSNISPISLELQIAQVVSVLFSLTLYIMLEKGLGPLQAAGSCLALGIIGYLIVLPRTFRKLDSACQCILEER